MQVLGSDKALPAGHARHTHAVLSANAVWPAGHGKQNDAPGVGEKLSNWHGWHGKMPPKGL